MFLPSGPYTEDARTSLEASLTALAAASPQHASYAIAPAAPGSSAMGTLRVVADGCDFGGLAIHLPSTPPTPSLPASSGADDRPVISIEVANTNITGGCPVGGLGMFTIFAPNPNASSNYALSVAVHNAMISVNCYVPSGIFAHYALLLYGLQLVGATIRIDNTTIHSNSITLRAIAFLMLQCTVTNRTRIDLCGTNLHASIDQGSGTAATIAFLLSMLADDSVITVGRSDISLSAPSSGENVVFGVANSKIASASVTLTGCSITIIHQLGIIPAIDPSMVIGTTLMSIEDSTLIESTIAMHDCVGYIKSFGAMAVIMYMSEYDGKGSVLLQDNTFVFFSGAADSNSAQQTPLVNALQLRWPKAGADFAFAMVNSSILGASPSDIGTPAPDGAFSVVKALEVTNQAPLSIHWLRSGFSFWEQPRAFWDELTVSQIIAGEAPAVDPMRLADMSTGVCAGHANFCSASSVLDNAPETDANFLPPLIALTDPPSTCPMPRRHGAAPGGGDPVEPTLHTRTSSASFSCLNNPFLVRSVGRISVPIRRRHHCFPNSLLDPPHHAAQCVVPPAARR